MMENLIEKALKQKRLETAIQLLEKALGIGDTAATMRSYQDWPKSKPHARRDMLNAWFADVTMEEVHRATR